MQRREYLERAKTFLETDKTKKHKNIFFIEIRKSSIIKRVGCLLEENGYYVYQTLKKYRNKKYIPLDPIAKSKGKRNSKWKLVI